MAGNTYKRYSFDKLQEIQRKLTADYTDKFDELAQCENSIGTSHDPARMNRLRREMEAIDRKLARCEIAIEMTIQS